MYIYVLKRWTPRTLRIALLPALLLADWLYYWFYYFATLLIYVCFDKMDAIYTSHILY